MYVSRKKVTEPGGGGGGHSTSQLRPWCRWGGGGVKTWPCHYRARKIHPVIIYLTRNIQMHSLPCCNIVLLGYTLSDWGCWADKQKSCDKRRPILIPCVNGDHTTLGRFDTLCQYWWPAKSYPVQRHVRAITFHNGARCHPRGGGGGGGTQMLLGRGCEAEASKSVPIFKGHFGGKGYPLLGVFRRKKGTLLCF